MKVKCLSPKCCFVVFVMSILRIRKTIRIKMNNNKNSNKNNVVHLYNNT